MGKIIPSCIIILLIGAMVSCESSKQRRSADYYKVNRQAINEMRNLYDQLYLHQPFSAGFTDKSYKYYVIEVTTDTLRYIFNNETNRDQFYSTIQRFRYDTSQLKKLAAKMKATQCLWLSKSSYYVGEKRETFTYLSFKSASTDKPFRENKYYILIFSNHPVRSEEGKAKIKKGDLVKIDELVYFMIGSNYR